MLELLKSADYILITDWERKKIVESARDIAMQLGDKLAFAGSSHWRINPKENELENVVMNRNQSNKPLNVMYSAPGFEMVFSWPKPFKETLVRNQTILSEWDPCLSITVHKIPQLLDMYEKIQDRHTQVFNWAESNLGVSLVGKPNPFLVIFNKQNFAKGEYKFRA